MLCHFLCLTEDSQRLHILGKIANQEEKVALYTVALEASTSVLINQQSMYKAALLDPIEELLTLTMF